MNVLNETAEDTCLKSLTGSLFSLFLLVSTRTFGHILTKIKNNNNPQKTKEL